MIRSAVLRTASRAEQEIRAYPRLYAAFYNLLTRSPAVRELVGRAKAGVRGGGGEGATSRTVSEPPLLRARREAAVAHRLGLRQ